MTHFSKLNRLIGPAFNRAAPDQIRWAAESAFFEMQVRACKAKTPDGYRYVLMDGIINETEETIDSMRNAARQIAAMGLSLNPTAKLVYFIPRRMRERYEDEAASDYQRVPWVVDATPSYMGLVYIATHYASCRVFGASEVYQADKFEHRGPFELPKHRPTRDNELRTEKLAEGVYAAAVLQSGDARMEYVDAPTVQRIRGLSKLANSLMYTTVWTEGWKKIAIRRLSKLVMQAEPRLMAAEQAMQRAEGFTFNEAGDVVDVPRETSGQERPQTAEKPRGMQGLRGKLNTATERQNEADEPEGPGALLALPAPSAHPEGSIEWWINQLDASDSRVRLDEIKAAALTVSIDQSVDADAFRGAFKRRSQELRNSQ